jgi:hypothetical protein
MPEIDEFSEKLGSIAQGVKYIERQVELAYTQREEILLRLNNLESVSGRVTEIEKRMRTAESALTTLGNERQQFIGMKKMTATIWAAVGAALVTALQVLQAVLQHFFKH